MTYAFLLFFVYCLICFMIWTCKRLRDWEIKENRAIDTSLLRASSAADYLRSLEKALEEFILVMDHNYTKTLDTVAWIGGGLDDAYLRMAYLAGAHLAGAHLAGAHQPLSVSSIEVHAEQIQQLGQCHELQLEALDWLKETYVSTHYDIERHRVSISRARAQVTSFQWSNLDDALNQEAEILDTLVERHEKTLLLASKLHLHLRAVSFGFLAIERCYEEVESRGIWDIGNIEHLGSLLHGMELSLKELGMIIRSGVIT